jgi:phosphohistidine phosphatase SixA
VIAKRSLLAWALVLGCCPAIGVASEHDAQVQAAWQALMRGGHALVFRHSIDEPGNGDPHPLYRFGDCTYQRQLVPEGRAKAERVGRLLRERGIRIGEVLSSEWCRARDSAQLIFGRHQTWAALNVMNPQTNPHMDTTRQSADVKARIAAHRGADNLVLVTHLLNIQPLLGESPAKGDAVVVSWNAASQTLVVVGRLQFNF